MYFGCQRDIHCLLLSIPEATNKDVPSAKCAALLYNIYGYYTPAMLFIMLFITAFFNFTSKPTKNMPEKKYKLGYFVSHYKWR